MKKIASVQDEVALLIANRLKAFRRELSLSQKEMAALLEVSVNTLYLFETGKRRLDLCRFVLLLARLNLTAEVALGGCAPAVLGLRVKIWK